MLAIFFLYLDQSSLKYNIWLALKKAFYKFGLKLTYWLAYSQLDDNKKDVLKWLAEPAAKPAPSEKNGWLGLQPRYSNLAGPLAQPNVAA